MSIDETALRECLQRVVHGTVDRRALLRWMIGLGLSGPCIAHLLVASTPAQAQTKQPVADFVPTRRGGGGKLRLLWWQAPTILNPTCLLAPRTPTPLVLSTNRWQRLTLTRTLCPFWP